MATTEERLAALEAWRTSVEGNLGPERPDDDPIVRFALKPKYYENDTFVGRHYSECPPAYLKATKKYYEACAFMARKNGEPDKAEQKMKSAGIAAEWAKFNASAKVPAAPPPEQAAFEDDCPF